MSAQTFACASGFDVSLAAHDIAVLRFSRSNRHSWNGPGQTECFAESAGFRWSESFRAVDISNNELRDSQANATDNLLICR